jgi:predicted RND superfamily exporter protein
MALKDISLDDKVKIALDAIIGEVFGKGSAEIAQKYSGVSTRAMTALKQQALDAIRDSFAGSTQAPVSVGISDKQISAGITRLLGSSSTIAQDTEEVDEEETEDSISVEQIVTAMMKYNDRAAKSNKQRIYISRTIAQEFAPHSVKEADEYFKENKKAIDAHNNKHDLRRNTNRALRGQNWQSWIEV